MPSIFSPSRPQLYSQPAYLAPSGRPIAPIGPLGVWPQPPDGQTCLVGAQFLIAPGTSTYFSTSIPLSQLPVFFQEWIDNPEGVLKEMFGYTYASGGKHHQKIQISLADLGL